MAHLYKTILVTFLLTLQLQGCSNESLDNESKKVMSADHLDKQQLSSWVTSPIDYVNPLIGTQGHENHRQAANVVPGASLPFGMLNFGPEHAYTKELLEQSERMKTKVLEQKKRVPVSPGGYNYDGTRIKGFSLTRLSGTGCLGASGDVPILPLTKPMKHSPDDDLLDAYYSAGFSHDNEVASPGYYQVTMDNDVDVKLTSTIRTGRAQFTYPKTTTPLLLFRTAYSQLGSGAAKTIVNKEAKEITGSVTSGNFCGYLGEYNRRDYYTLHFVVQLNVPIKASGVWKDKVVQKGLQQIEGGMGYGDDGVPDLGKGSGAWVELELSESNVVEMKVGISYVSLENARLNLQQEQKSSVTFSQLKINAEQQWNESLSGIKVESNDIDQLTTFYTALYHTQFHPNIFSDINGEYRGFDNRVHKIKGNQKAQYANFSGWDVYRSQLQLLTLMNQQRGSDIAQSLYHQSLQNNGVWDRWTHNNGATGVMSGDPSTIAIANFYAFGARGFDVEGAYRSLYEAATNPTTLDLSHEGCPVFCRGQKPSLDQWLTLNYISDESNSWEGASETLEQSASDFALAQLAHRLEKTSDYELFSKRANNWANLFNPKATTTEGFIQGRLKNGNWKGAFDPHSVHLFVEGSPAQYLWMLPFNGKRLIELLGGDKLASKRLDNHFKNEKGEWVLYRDSGQFADVSNQPSITSPWMYLFTGDAYKTQETVRAVIDKLWKNAPDGIPGQDDLGQMSSWYVFSSLGIYPLYPGRADLVFSAPTFRRASIGNLTLIAPKASKHDKYIHSVRINGRRHEQLWIDDRYINEKQKLQFELSQLPNRLLGNGKQDRPPSF